MSSYSWLLAKEKSEVCDWLSFTDYLPVSKITVKVTGCISVNLTFRILVLLLSLGHCLGGRRALRVSSDVVSLRARALLFC